MTKYTSKWMDDLRAALDYINSNDVAELHRKTLQRALEAALLETADILEKRETSENEGKPWKPQEIEALKIFLEKRGIAKTFEEEKDAIDTAVQRFKRNGRSIKRKAVELGLGDHTDYWLAKTRHGLSGERP